MENRFQIATKGHVFPRNTETLEEEAGLGTEKAAGGCGVEGVGSGVVGGGTSDST